MSLRYSGSRKRAAAFIASRLLALFFLAWAAFYLVTALFAINNFAWRQPMFDQWRMYASFLSQTFPDNVLQPESGHRPIIPNLIRLAENHWFAGNQLVQISIGTLCAFLTAGIVAFSIWRDRELSLVARSACVMLAVLGVFWMANARMLLHGNEALQTYLVTLFTVCAGLCTWQARQNNSLRWLGAASAACVVATFGFGSGIASFPTIIVLGVILRLPLRRLLLPVIVLALCLLLYLVVLPGNHGVRGTLNLHPLESSHIVAQWLSSPWANAWLGLADPPLQPWLLPNLQDKLLGNVLIASAGALTTNMAWPSLTAALGFTGIVIVLARLAALYLQRTELTQLQAVAATLCLMGLATSVVISVVRLDYLLANPAQIYADRYLVWPCLFWVGLALLLLIDASRAKNRAITVAGLLLLTALPAGLLPTHCAWIDWGALVYQTAQQTAAAARSGVFDADLFPDDPAASRALRLAALDLMRQQRLAMFSDPAWELVGSRWSGNLKRSDEYAVYASIVGAVSDRTDAETALHFHGWIEHGISALRRHGQLAVLDDAGAIAGLAEFSFIKTNGESLRLGPWHKRGFDGYIKNYHAERTYTLVNLDVVNSNATELAILHTSGVRAVGREY